MNRKELVLVGFALLAVSGLSLSLVANSELQQQNQDLQQEVSELNQQNKSLQDFKNEVTQFAGDDDLEYNPNVRIADCKRNWSEGYTEIETVDSNRFNCNVEKSDSGELGIYHSEVIIYSSSGEEIYDGYMVEGDQWRLEKGQQVVVNTPTQYFVYDVVATEGFEVDSSVINITKDSSHKLPLKLEENTTEKPFFSGNNAFKEGDSE